MKKFLIAILIVLVIVLSAVVFYLVVSNDGPFVPADNADVEKIYTNEEFGFQMIFPELWQDVVITSNVNENFSDLGFSFKRGQPFLIFQILKYDAEQWARADQSWVKNILAKTNEATYVCSGCCSAKGDMTGGGQFDEFQIERCKESAELLKTFKLLD